MVHHDPETKSPDPAAPVLYLPQLWKATEEGDYVPARVFGAVETAMLWKPLNNPICPFEEHEPADSDMRSAKTERLMFLFCANTSGDLIVKPLPLYRKLGPCLLRGKSELSCQYTGVQREKAG